MHEPYNICMSTDFFFPNTGGVENHVYQLSQCLLAHKHKVVIITHSYDDRSGVRYMTSGMKVYYLPVMVVYNQSSLPTLFSTFAMVRNILIRERINIVHGHSAFSAIAHEVMFHAITLGIKTVFTDHSLFGFADASAIITNKLLEMSLAFCDRVICVSHTGKENTALRAGVTPSKISVIPNAVDTSVFTPDVSKKDPEKITIVVASRLVYRKGVDLLAGIIPIIISKYDNTKFIIGGDGPKRIVLEELIENHQLQDRVEIIGALKHEEVRDLLVKGDIFLNASLTEAFCMAIVEAASCGLKVVSTKVGGIPEVLPPDLIYLTDPSVDGLLDGLEQAIHDILSNKYIDAKEMHFRVKNYYKWENVLSRTEAVYDAASKDAHQSFGQRLIKCKELGIVSGSLAATLGIIEYCLLIFYNWLHPSHLIDIVPDSIKLF